jgi:glyoxylate reductase
MLSAEADVWVSPHDRPLTSSELHRAVAGADAVLTLLHDRVDSAFLDAAGDRLRCIANVAVGYDNVDVAAAHARGIAVTNTPRVLTDATADLAIGLILATTRRLVEGDRLLRWREPWSWHMFFQLGTGLLDKTLGIVGLGQIGAATAQRARALGMRITYCGRRRTNPAIEDSLQARRLELDDLLSCADVVSLHCPLTPETRHLIDAERLRSMRSTAYLVNTARGAIIDEGALAEALRLGVIAGAALDVFEDEPKVHPGLLGLENVVLVPHIGSATVETRTAMAVLAAQNALAVLAGATPPTPVGAGVGAR